MTVIKDRFHPGDTVICKSHVRFIDGTEHTPGQEIVITKETCAYFNVCHKDYEKKEVR